MAEQSACWSDLLALARPADPGRREGAADAAAGGDAVRPLERPEAAAPTRRRRPAPRCGRRRARGRPRPRHARAQRLDLGRPLRSAWPAGAARAARRDAARLRARGARPRPGVALSPCTLEGVESFAAALGLLDRA